MGQGVAAEGGEGEQDGEADGVAEEDDAEGGTHGSAGVLGSHATGEVSSAPQDGGGEGEEGPCGEGGKIHGACSGFFGLGGVEGEQ